MAAKLTRLTHKIAIQLHPMAESCTICNSRSRWPVRKHLATPSYTISLRYILILSFSLCGGGGEYQFLLQLACYSYNSQPGCAEAPTQQFRVYLSYPKVPGLSHNEKLTFDITIQRQYKALWR